MNCCAAWAALPVGDASLCGVSVAVDGVAVLATLTGEMKSQPSATTTVAGFDSADTATGSVDPRDSRRVGITTVVVLVLTEEPAEGPPVTKDGDMDLDATSLPNTSSIAMLSDDDMEGRADGMALAASPPARSFRIFNVFSLD